MLFKYHGTVGPVLNWDTAKSPAENSDWSSTADESVDLKHYLAISTKSEHILWLSDSTPRYISDRNVYIRLPKDKSIQEHS